MSIITPISYAIPWYIRENPTSAKFTAEVNSKLNILILNQISVNDYTDELLQGSTGGAEQARVPLLMVSAPSGWTRDAAVISGSTLRITDGVTVPPGVDPNIIGGQAGGSWTVSGCSAASTANHTHTMGTHTHSTNHSHTAPVHSHDLGSHTHPIATHAHSGLASIGGESKNSDYGNLLLWIGGTLSPFGTVVSSGHTHTIGTHSHGGSYTSNTGTTGGPSSNTTGSSTVTITDQSSVISGTPSDDVSGSSGAHLHTIAHDGSWSPKFATVIICTKD
jgi:hypothetical protein